MKNNITLTITSLLSIVLFAVHQADDIRRGFEPGGFEASRAIVIMVIWLYGTLELGERRSGHVIMLLGGLLGSVVPAAHMRGAGMVGGRIVGSDGILFFVSCLLVLGVTAMFSVVHSARGLWNLRRGLSAP